MQRLRTQIGFAAVLLCISALAVPRVFANTSLTVSSSVTITAYVNGPGGGTGGGGGGGIPTPTVVHFSGKSYPNSTVIILKNGVQATTLAVDSDANFSTTLNNLSEGTYTFSVYTIDAEGRHSVAFSFPVYIRAGTTTNIGDILLSPTIDINKTEVRRGDPITIFGYAVPNASVTITVHSDTSHLVTTTTDKTGSYLYRFGTAPLEYGSHDAQSRSTLADTVSSMTNPVSFIVSDKNVFKGPAQSCGDLIGDLNCDDRVNLVDFSIMAYWFEKPGFPMDIDLSNDNKIDLVDLSILAYHWTG
jgi:hypothetical protein